MIFFLFFTFQGSPPNTPVAIEVARVRLSLCILIIMSMQFTEIFKVVKNENFR